VTRATSAPTLRFPAMAIATRAGAFANCEAPISSRTTVRDKRTSTTATPASTDSPPAPTPPCTGPTIHFPAPTLRIPGPPIDFPPPTHWTRAPIRQTPWLNALRLYAVSAARHPRCWALAPFGIRPVRRLDRSSAATDSVVSTSQALRSSTPFYCT